MSATLFFAPQARFFTPQITSMGGAYLQFLDSETDAPADVYLNADLSTSLGSVVTSDANGQFVAIYLDSATTYRIQLFNSADVLQWDIDPYLPSRDYEPGTVITWFGAAVDLESHYPSALWQICDGTNSSPDMEGRVAIGVGAGFVVDDSGGSASAVFTTATDGAHEHTEVTSGAHTLTTAEMPAHTHGVIDSQSLGPGTPGYITGPRTDTGILPTKTEGGGDPHTHPDGVAATTDSEHEHNGTVNVMQPYRALYMLMRRYP
jgi:microcystin-dependent protein